MRKWHSPLFVCMKTKKSHILTPNKEDETMEKGRKRIRFCLYFVVLTAIVVGILYYYGQLQEQATISEGTLISSLGMELKQLWR